MEASQQNILAINNLVIQSRFGPLAKRVGFSDETRDELESLLFSKAEMSFLWLNIVLQSLESSPLTSKKDFKHIIDNLPRKLEATYTEFLHRIPVESRGLARDILRLLVGSSRHLTLDEMNIAYTINKEEYRTIEKVTEDRQSAIERMLLGVVGPFIRIEGSKVSLIHQSVKDCLAGYTHSTSDEVIRSFGISPSIAALEIASACSRYLLLDDFTINLFAGAQFSDSGEVDQTVIADSDLFLFDSFAALVDGPFLDFEENYAEDYCSRIIQRYKFFEYAAMHWAEHYAQCESIAPKEMQDAVRKLTQRGSHVLKNWMKFFWIKMDIEFALPDDFDTFMASAFFDFPRLLEKCLLEDIHINQDQKDRALFWAARMGCASSLEVLLRHGVNPNSRVLHLHTPLTIASHHGHVKVIKVLIADSRTNINTGGGRFSRSALSFAAGNSHMEVFQMLFDQQDCRPDHEDENGCTPLFWAIERDHTAIARLLLRHPAVDVNHVNRYGRSVLSWAADEGFLQALKMLLAHPNVKVNLKDSKGRSPLLWAANSGQEKIIDALMQGEYDVDRSSKDNYQRSALSLACSQGHTDTVKALMKYKCGDEDEEDVDGWTPLAWALDRKSPKTVEAVLSGRRVNLDRRDWSGRTVLIWAANYGYTEVVQMLLEQGADRHIADDDGRTALDFARMFGWSEVTRLLEKELDTVYSKGSPL
jgi:ankyrin repeat protein